MHTWYVLFSRITFVEGECILVPQTCFISCEPCSESASYLLHNDTVTQSYFSQIPMPAGHDLSLHQDVSQSGASNDAMEDAVCPMSDTEVTSQALTHSTAGAVDVVSQTDTVCMLPCTCIMPCVLPDRTATSSTSSWICGTFSCPRNIFATPCCTKTKQLLVFFYM